MTIDGFSSNQIHVVDITDPANPVVIQGSVEQGSVTFAGASGINRTVLAFTNATKAQAASVYANKPSSLRDSQNRADVLMVSHADFIDSLAPLKKLRQDQGRTVSIVDIEDVFDEFNFGERSPYAIKSFLANATAAWSQKPRWVLFVGGSTPDPRDYLKLGATDYIPVEFVACRG